MIQANELRLGNYFETPEQKEKVREISFSYDEGVTFINDWNVSIIKPIPLTEEILLKCGFEKKNGYVFRKIGFILNGRKVKDSIGFHFIHYECTTECSYLHQLQNLYFALTGEELNVEL